MLNFAITEFYEVRPWPKVGFSGLARASYGYRASSKPSRR
jgi:hypothetical protein